MMQVTSSLSLYYFKQWLESEIATKQAILKDGTYKHIGQPKKKLLKQYITLVGGQVSGLKIALDEVNKRLREYE